MASAGGGGSADGRGFDGENVGHITLEVAVADTGCGIKEIDQKALFTPYGSTAAGKEDPPPASDWRFRGSSPINTTEKSRYRPK